MPRQLFVYILASRSRRLYVGVTNNLLRRVYEHRHSLCDFTARYRIIRLVYFETTGNVGSAIAREKQVKGWTRARKLALIDQSNPKWDDLAAEWLPEKSPTADPSSLRSSG